MATTSLPDESPYTPAGDVAEVFAGLADVDVYEVRDGHVDEESVLPELDDALAELAATVDGPVTSVSDDEDEHGAASDRGASGGLTRERAEFESVAANTDVESIPYENAAAFLANTLYSVPPANTRFEWVASEDPSPDWQLDVDW
jgi:hypothetical protein